MNRTTFINECIHSYVLNIYLRILYIYKKKQYIVLRILYIIEYILYKRYYTFMNYNGNFIIKGN